MGSEIMFKFLFKFIGFGRLNNNKEIIQETDQDLVSRCQNNNLSFNVNKIRELVVDLRKWGGWGEHNPVHISEAAVEMNNSFQVPRHPYHQQPDLVLSH